MKPKFKRGDRVWATCQIGPQINWLPGLGPVPAGTCGEIVEICRRPFGVVDYRVSFENGTDEWVANGHLVLEFER